MAYQTGKTKGEESPELAVGTLTERTLIRKYVAPLTHTQPIALDVEDDGAVIDFPAGRMLVMTTDAIVEGVHFFSQDAPETVAKKALRVNLSDLAAMGAHPIGYTVSIILNSSVTEEWIARFYSSLGEDNHKYRISLLGGDTSRTEGPIAITVTAIGDVDEGRALYRAGAQSGDRIYVTGTIGDAALGLKIHRNEYVELSDADKAFLLSRYHVPLPRHVLAQTLGQVAHSATDISDGLLLDLDLICEASGLNAYIRLDKIPLSKALRNLLRQTEEVDRQALYQTILSGGDDYELIFTTSPGEADHIEYLAQRHGVPITCIGHLGLKTDEESTPVQRINLIDEGGKPLSIQYMGYEHKW